MEQNHTPERIINLTLEIIYQLTGEDWENVEGHEEVYRNITVENQPPLTSPDESRNTPERCPHPLFSQDSTQEHQEIPQEDQDKNHIIYGIETREEAEDPYVMGDDRCKEEELPPEFSTDPSGSESKVKDEDKEEAHVNIKEERIPIEISTVGSSNRNTLKTCSSSLSSLELTQNYDKIPQKEKDTNLVTIKQEEEKITRGDDPCKKEPNLSEIGSDGRYKRCNTEEHPSVLSQDSDVPNNTQGGTFLDRSSIITVHLEMGMFPCSRCGERFNSRDELTAHQRSNHGPGRTYACPECGKSFTQKYVLRRHQAWHSGDTPFSCSVCALQMGLYSKYGHTEK
ncbi:uncharacterized protein [Pyxicephalus adspersus]|uniref:uncharacterized protein isoform X2 n=1 Tax=Pyxicephalus adspersus TaxID=30357 RepID=UPI003B58F042